MISLLIVSMHTAMASSVWLAGSSVLNDPVLIRRGLGLGAEYSLTDAFGVQASLSWFPVTEWNHLQPVTESLINDLMVSPDMSLMTARGAAQMSWWPLRITQDQSMSRFGIQSGVGLVHTRDDLEGMQVAPEDPVYAETANQLHPTLQLGLSGEAYRGSVGVRLSLEGMLYREQIGDLEPQPVAYSLLTLGVVVGPQPSRDGG